jgi:hypothetical protein
MNDISLAQCYEILNISPGATLDQVEAAYARRVMDMLRQGAKAEQARLKTAYHRVKNDVLGREIAGETVIPDGYQALADGLNQALRSRQIHVRVSPAPGHEPGQGVQIFLQGQPVPKLELALWVQRWMQRWVQGRNLSVNQTVVVYGMRSQRAIAWKQQFQIDRAGPNPDDCDPYAYNNRYINGLAFPVAFLTMILLNPLLKFLLLPFHIWIHEFGHATVAWLAGHQATPLPLGWTNVGEERSLIVYGCFLALLGLLGWTGWRERKRGIIVWAAAVAVLQFYMTWMLSRDTFELWLAFGGVGGEFYLSVLLMVGFYFPLPERWRWDFWRYPVLLIAASTFVNSFGMWRQIRQGESAIPWGTLLGGEGDAGGDMDQLSAYGWSDLQIIQTYTHLGNGCLFILIGVYIFFLLKQNSRFGWKSRLPQNHARQ